MRRAKKAILSRYARTEDGKIVLDVTAGRIEDLFSNFDRVSPYTRKDLDPDVVDYMTDCARELGGEDFVIRINLAEPFEDAPMSRVIQGIQNYFVYVQQVERRRMRALFRNSFALLGVGVALLVGMLWIRRTLSPKPGLVGTIGIEGLTIAGWVALWEAVATFLLQWPPHRRELRLYRRIADAPVLFRTRCDELPPGS